jgi:long-chain acyl-CoA synthetase
MKKQFATMPDAFMYYERTQPGKLFLAEPVKGTYHRFTWGEAGQQVRSMAAALNAMGLGKDDKIAILSKNCAHWIMADLAIAMAGCISVPLYPNITPDGLKEIILHSECKTIFIGKLDNPAELRKGVPEGLTQISFPFYPNEGCINWDDLVKANPPIQHDPKIDPQALACIVYTSGTTGQPKGVMHNFHSVAFAVNGFLESYPEIDDEIFFSYLPLCHVAERMLVECGTIFTGSSVYFVESLDTFAANLQYTKPTIFLAVPRIWEKMQEGILKKIPQKKLSMLLSIPIVSGIIKRTIQKKLGLNRVRYVFTGASPINPAVLTWYAKIGLVIQEAYGMTENLAYSHSNRKGRERFGTVGQPYLNITVRLNAEKEVQVKSDASMLGYYKEPELTAAAFEDGYLRTGDEGSIDEDGYLTITGRIKDQFKTSKGKYIMPAPIESSLLTCTVIGQSCVIGSGMPNAMGLCTLSESARSLDRAELEAELKNILAVTNERLEHFEQLSKLVVLPEEWTIANDLLTPTLKIKRRMIDAAFGLHYETWSRAGGQVLFV